MSAEYLDCVEVDPESAPACVVIWLHGHGANGKDFKAYAAVLQLPASLAARFVFPTAPQRSAMVSAGTVNRAWFEIHAGDVSGKVELDGIEASAQHLRNLIQRELDRGVPSEKILLAGFSHGGTIALHTALGYEKRLAGVLAMSAYLPTCADLEKARRDVNREIPIMMTHGELDPVIPIAQAESTRDALTRMGYAVEWHTYPMMHHVCIEEFADIRKWLLEVLRPA
ncbi:MAG: hypothetical protein [Olavius algarvensis Delta 4 endosymbiont]|nr:MAG: hypothetical protein [Olavius algarvensis Delta 4 endosymbiont]